MLDDYDEKQRFYRYKHGHHAFLLIIILLFVNGIFGTTLDFQWGETVHIENMLLTLISFLYFTGMNVYRGAHFRKSDNPKWSNLSFLVLALLQIFQVVSRDEGVMTDGKVSFTAINLAIGICFLSVPLLYYIRIIIEKINNRKNS